MPELSRSAASAVFLQVEGLPIVLFEEGV